MRDYAAMEAAAEASGKFNDLVVVIGKTQTSMRSTYGLWLKTGQPVIGAPEAQTKLEYPPGYDFVYDFTKALDGNVHFQQRAITASFVCDRPKAHWESIRSKLETALQGQWLEFWFTIDPENHYTGFFEVELKPGKHMATVDITATCEV